MMLMFQSSMFAWEWISFIGWIQVLTTEPQHKEAGPGDNVKVSEENNNKITGLR